MQKVLVDWTKHVTTLSLGGLVLVPALLEKVFPTGRDKWAVGLASALFVAAIGLAMIAILLILGTAAGRRPSERRQAGDRFAELAVAAWAAFFLGVLFLGGFALHNLR